MCKPQDIAITPAALLADTTIHPIAKTVYAAMAAHLDESQKFEDRLTYVSQTAVAEFLGINKRTVSKYVKELVAGGYLVPVDQHQHASGRSTVVYHMPLPRVHRGTQSAPKVGTQSAPQEVPEVHRRSGSEVPRVHPYKEPEELLIEETETKGITRHVDVDRPVRIKVPKAPQVPEAPRKPKASPGKPKAQLPGISGEALETVVWDTVKAQPQSLESLDQYLEQRYLMPNTAKAVTMLRHRTNGHRLEQREGILYAAG